LSSVSREEKPVLALALLLQEISYGALYVYMSPFILLVVGFVATTLVLARLISPSRKSLRAKGQNYETKEARGGTPR